MEDTDSSSSSSSEEEYYDDIIDDGSDSGIDSDTESQYDDEDVGYFYYKKKMRRQAKVLALKTRITETKKYNHLILFKLFPGLIVNKILEYWDEYADIRKRMKHQYRVKSVFKYSSCILAYNHENFDEYIETYNVEMNKRLIGMGIEFDF